MEPRLGQSLGRGHVGTAESASAPSGFTTVGPWSSGHSVFNTAADANEKERLPAGRLHQI